jgi:iron(III) transport system substrate-binding protein
VIVRAFTSAILGLAAALAAVLPAHAQSGDRPAGSITVYNAQHVSLTEAWVAGFTKATGVKVVLRNGSDTELANQLVQEGAASPADVFLTENSPGMALVDRAGLLAELPSEVRAQTAEAYWPRQGKWVGIAARATVFAYNTTKLKAEQLPKSIMDLVQPAWQGRWAASPAGADFQAIISAMLQLKGEAATADWLKAMKTNAKPYRGNNAAMKGVNDGQVDGAVIYHYYVFTDRAKTGENSKNVGLHFFKGKDPGAFISLSGGGVLASSKNKPAAIAFLKWIAGSDGQDVLRTGDSFEFAVGKGAASNPKLPPLTDLDGPVVDASTLDTRKVVDLLMQAGLL